MKNLILAFTALTCVACGSPKENKEAQTPEQPVSKESKPPALNKEVPDEEDGGTMLIGKINKKAFQKEPYADWFQANEDFHTLDTATVKKIKPLLKDVKITAFMGSWCSDSQREIPALYSILEYADYNFNRFDLYATDHQKLTEEGYENNLNIDFVPTIIFYKNGKELGRFVEYAQESLEKDMLTIVSGADYKHAYEE
ncbi:thioredoxin family protein [Marixanthomonas spongiae]|uniref:Thiol reductase thioredoxin n=1 Tax=Marixanthomonas spongiae TaxID=2174845 RepID=A0A2U0I7F4_9FLAO|nr:thioredoxin family protein [Marixanthomonas spongiae]PVW17028.1 thiol reductase thioredoxin [Marixanthomonas spongiae]